MIVTCLSSLTLPDLCDFSVTGGGHQGDRLHDHPSEALRQRSRRVHLRQGHEQLDGTRPLVTPGGHGSGREVTTPA